jgi:hypothetical protein
VEDIKAIQLIDSGEVDPKRDNGGNAEATQPCGAGARSRPLDGEGLLFGTAAV